MVNPLTQAVYLDTKVGSPGPPGDRAKGPNVNAHGGPQSCDPQPTVAFAPRCDGSMDVTLGNGNGNGTAANVDAAFTVTNDGGQSQFVRVASGATQTVNVKNAGTVTVQDNTFHTSTAAWSDSPDCAK